MRAVFMKYLNQKSGKPEVVAVASTDQPPSKIGARMLMTHAQNRITAMIERGELKEADIYEVNLRNYA